MGRWKGSRVVIGGWMVGLEKGGRIGFGTIRVNVRVDIRVKAESIQVGSGQVRSKPGNRNGY